MGRYFSSPREEREFYAKRQAEALAAQAQREEAKERKRMELAGKIAMVIIDKVNRDIIRPGPDPEERECYDMSQELRDIAPEMEALIASVLAVDAKAATETES